MPTNNYPKLHNATWPGIVGKGAGSEPVISLDTLLALTAGASADGATFDGIDIGLFDPHFQIDITDEGAAALAGRLSGLNLVVGSLVAPIWPPAGGSAMGSKEERGRFVEQVRRACEFGKKLRTAGIRPYGVIRIDSAVNPETWAADAVNEVGSMVARAWPAVTVCPTVTLTAVTEPLTANERLAWLAGSMVPVDDTVWVMVPVVTDSVWLVVVMDGPAADDWVPNQIPAPAPARTTSTTTAAMLRRLVNSRLALHRTGPSSFRLRIAFRYMALRPAGRFHPVRGAGSI